MSDKPSGQPLPQQPAAQPIPTPPQPRGQQPDRIQKSVDPSQISPITRGK